jgi:hypothetical protein
MWDSLFSRMRSVYHLGRDALKNVKKLGHRVVNIAKSRHGQGLLSAVDQFIPGAKQKVNSAIEWGSNNILNNLNKVDKFANRAESLYDNVVNAKMAKLKKTSQRTLERMKPRKNEDWLGAEWFHP